MWWKWGKMWWNHHKSRQNVVEMGLNVVEPPQNKAKCGGNGVKCGGTTTKRVVTSQRSNQPIREVPSVFKKLTVIMTSYYGCEGVTCSDVTTFESTNQRGPLSFLKINGH